MFLMNSDCNHYSNLVHDIENEYTWGSDMYPATLHAAYDYIVNYRPDSKTSQHDPNESGLSYYTEDNDNSRHGRDHGGRGTGHGVGHSRGNRRGCRGSGKSGRDSTPARDPAATQGHTHNQTNGDADDDAWIT